MIVFIVNHSTLAGQMYFDNHLYFQCSLTRQNFQRKLLKFHQCDSLTKLIDHIVPIYDRVIFIANYLILAKIFLGWGVKLLGGCVPRKEGGILVLEGLTPFSHTVLSPLRTLWLSLYINNIWFGIFSIKKWCLLILLIGNYYRIVFHWWSYHGQIF
jgi:hypothetical protein